MIYSWDEAKSAANLAKHRVSFATAALVFDDPYAISIQDRLVDGEERWQTVGHVGNGVLLLVAHTAEEGEGGEIVIRVISARKATRLERRAYEDRRK